jgi:hypothetical protein
MSSAAAKAVAGGVSWTAWEDTMKKISFTVKFGLMAAVLNDTAGEISNTADYSREIQFSLRFEF